VLPLVSHVEYAPTGQTNRNGRTDGRQIITLRFLLKAASNVTSNVVCHDNFLVKMCETRNDGKRACKILGLLDQSLPDFYQT